MFPGRESSEQFAKEFHRKISDVYCTSELDALAEQTGFKVRKSKLTPIMFLDTLLFKELNSASASLEDHCIALKQRYQLSIKKQSLSERFDEGAVRFIQGLLNRHLSTQISATLQKEKLGKVIQHFSSIKIKDSTRFQVPACFKDYYPGSTGAATGAGVHIQFEFDLLNGKVHDLHVTDAMRQDTIDAHQTIHSIEKGSLIIRDLGYFSTSLLNQIQRKDAYYITRPKPRMVFTHAQHGKPVDISAIYQKMKRNRLVHLELPVLIGDQKLPNRLIIEMLPEKEVQKRLIKAGREARKKGRSLSADYKSGARLNLFLTNVPLDWVATQQVRTLYQLRWQIELRFKAWKSFYSIDAIKKMQRWRFECYLYATLLLLMINLEIANNFSAILWRHTSRPLSFLKFYKIAYQYLGVLRKGMLEKTDILLNYLSFLYQISHEKLLTEKRKYHRSPLQEILSLNTLD